MGTRSIQEGDIVSVNFNNAQYTLCNRAKVLHTPSATGDSWYFQDVETKQEWAVSEGCTITLIEPHAPNVKGETSDVSTALDRSNDSL